jgi:hypothetical protein
VDRDALSGAAHVLHGAERRIEREARLAQLADGAAQGL